MPAFIVEGFATVRVRVRVRTFAEGEREAQDKAAAILREPREWLSCKRDDASPPKNATPLKAWRDYAYARSQPGGGETPEVRG